MRGIGQGVVGCRERREVKKGYVEGWWVGH